MRSGREGQSLAFSACDILKTFHLGSRVIGRSMCVSGRSERGVGLVWVWTCFGELDLSQAFQSVVAH